MTTTYTHTEDHHLVTDGPVIDGKRVTEVVVSKLIGGATRPTVRLYGVPVRGKSQQPVLIDPDDADVPFCEDVRRVIVMQHDLGAVLDVVAAAVLAEQTRPLLASAELLTETDPDMAEQLTARWTSTVAEAITGEPPKAAT